MPLIHTVWEKRELPALQHENTRHGQHTCIGHATPLCTDCGMQAGGMQAGDDQHNANNVLLHIRNNNDHVHVDPNVSRRWLQACAVLPTRGMDSCAQCSDAADHVHVVCFGPCRRPCGCREGERATVREACAGFGDVCVRSSVGRCRDQPRRRRAGRHAPARSRRRLFLHPVHTN